MLPTDPWHLCVSAQPHHCLLSKSVVMLSLFSFDRAVYRCAVCRPLEIEGADPNAIHRVPFIIADDLAAAAGKPALNDR